MSEVSISNCIDYNKNQKRLF